MRRLYVAGLTLAAITLSACGSLRRKPGAGTYSEHKIQVGALERSYIRYSPAGDTPDTLLILLHGGGGKASQFLRLARDMPSLADKQHFLLVYPDGIGGHWNDGRGDGKERASCPPSPVTSCNVGYISEAAKKNIDDIGFLRALIRELSAPGKIRRVAVAGISNGGMMAQRVACEMGDVVSLAVTVAANLPVELEKKCVPVKPLRVAFIAGVEDPIVPYAGGPIKVLRSERGIVLSIEDSLSFWSRRFNCKPGRDETMTASSFRRDYVCAEGGLHLIAVRNGGHAWPGGMPYLPEFVIGKTSDEFSASEKIVAFMSAD